MRERELQDTRVLPALKLLASLPNEPGADRFTPAHLLPQFTHADNPEFELDPCKPSYETLVVCNTPAAVAALAMPHNIERVQQASQIIVVMFLTEDAKDYSQHSVKHWEDLTGGEGGRFGRLSDALLKDAALNKKCRDIVTMDGKHRFEDTVFGQRALGSGLISQLLYIFRNDMASKQLTFAFFRDTYTANGTRPAHKNLAIGPSKDSWECSTCEVLDDGEVESFDNGFDKLSEPETKSEQRFKGV